MWVRVAPRDGVARLACDGEAIDEPAGTPTPRSEPSRVNGHLDRVLIDHEPGEHRFVVTIFRSGA